MHDDTDRLPHDAAARPSRSLDLAELNGRRLRRRNRRRALGSLAAVAVLAVAVVSVIELSAGGPSVDFVPATSPHGAPGSADPVELVGLWEVRDAAGEEQGAVLKLDGPEVVPRSVEVR